MLCYSTGLVGVVLVNRNLDKNLACVAQVKRLKERDRALREEIGPYSVGLLYPIFLDRVDNITEENGYGEMACLLCQLTGGRADPAANSGYGNTFHGPAKREARRIAGLVGEREGRTFIQSSVHSSHTIH